MYLHQALVEMFPDYKPGDWVVGQSGNGPVRIEHWNRPETQPSNKQIEPYLLAAAKRRQRGSINRYRDRAREAGVEYDGHVYDTDANSVLLITATIASIEAGLTLPAAPGGSFYWTTAHDEDVPHDAASLRALAQAMLNHGFSVHHQSRLRKKAIAAARNEAAVDAVNWD